MIIRVKKESHFGKLLYLCTVKFKIMKIMEAKTTTFTAMQWARHEKFVEMLRVVKQRKRERQTQIEMRLKEEAEYVRKERARLDAIYKDLDDEIV